MYKYFIHLRVEHEHLTSRRHVYGYFIKGWTRAYKSKQSTVQMFNKYVSQAH